ncbi:choline/glycine/proline betaine transport protein [Nocardioides marinisabuli]|uniref:Choline/glycine/proline betaine transport protein n=1 Tax=Nocardioides marinisabuli TaxID=419476 RepID=A0A7Y9F0W9_9ACTN|nr:BCCT family transporter [Nocardioides marinisabuli]NYD57331.1 choline/glycine/proline betaine transport protein [Nocardioides marinisabuli]
MTSSPPTERTTPPGEPSDDGSRPTPRTARGRFPMAAPRVFIPAAVILVLFSATAAIFPDRMGDWLASANTNVVIDLGWWYVLVVTSFVAFSLWMALSPMGSIVLGKDDEDPEFGLKSWFAMLFAAGMGIGLVFWGVAEPLNHLATPPPGTDVAGGPDQVARTAMDTTFLHWGLHAWAIYVVVGLAIAYAVHRKGRPISIRWALEPLLGKRILGFWGDVVDVVAIVGTLFGVATSLGFGVKQVGAGLSFLGVVDEASTPLLVLLIAIITGVALVSVVTGVDKGIRYLSNINMGVAAGLLVAVLLLGPTVFLLSDFVTQIGSYLQNFLKLSFDVRPFQGEAGQSWLSGWTTYYWGWWMSWAPFVGVFIARISRGRTVREFVLGVLLVPTMVTFLWFSVLGGTAIWTEMFGGGGLIGEEGVSTDLALFQMLDTLPLGTVLSVVAIFLIVVFFVTSSDSGSFVVDMLAEGGDPNPPVWSRAFWASMEGVVAAVLLMAGAGGLAALQTSAILVAAPFSIIMVLLMIATAKALLAENRVIQRKKRKWLATQIADEVTEGLQDSGTIPAVDATPTKGSPRR